MQGLLAHVQAEATSYIQSGYRGTRLCGSLLENWARDAKQGGRGYCSWGNITGALTLENCATAGPAYKGRVCGAGR